MKPVQPRSRGFSLLEVPAQRQSVRRVQPRSRGFSLLEVVVAIVILSFITLASWYSFDGIARMKEISEMNEEVSNSARVAMQRIGREVRMSFLTLNPSPTSAYLTAFWGEDQQAMDRLTFNTFSHTRLYRESKEADSTEITYFLAPDPDAPGLYLLLHREAPRIDGKPDEGGVVEVLARRVAGFNLRYYDNVKQEWADVWDSTSAENQLRMPRAIEVAISLVDPEGVEHPYVTTFLLPMYKSLGNVGPIPKKVGG